MHSDFKAVYDDQHVGVLHAAAENGETEIIELLVSQGCLVDSRNREGLTPLMMAALYDEPSTFQMLLQNGADPSLKDNDGLSPLHYAAKVVVHLLSTTCYHLVLTLIQGPMLASLH